MIFTFCRLLADGLLDSHTRPIALEVMDEATYEVECLESLISLKPNLETCGQAGNSMRLDLAHILGRSLQYRFLSHPTGFRYLSRSKFIDSEIEEWLKEENLIAYSQNLETALAHAFERFHPPLEEDDIPNIPINYDEEEDIQKKADQEKDREGKAGDRETKDGDENKSKCKAESESTSKQDGKDDGNLNEEKDKSVSKEDKKDHDNEKKVDENKSSKTDEDKPNAETKTDNEEASDDSLSDDDDEESQDAKVFLPPHFLGELAKTVETKKLSSEFIQVSGCKMIEKLNLIPKFLDILEDDSDDPPQIQLGVTWALV